MTLTGKNPNASTPQADDKTRNSIAPFMVAIKGLLDFRNDYLQNFEEQFPIVRAEFLTKLADGMSRAVHGERAYMKTSESTQIHLLER